MATLSELQAYEAKLIKAAADPTKAVYFDDFKRENRPFDEITQQLSWVRGEIARAQAAAGTATLRNRRLLPRAVSDL